MPKFTLRPFFRRISSKYSNASTLSEADTDTTAATSATSNASSPDLLPGHPPRISSSLTKLPAKLRDSEARADSLPNLRAAAIVKEYQLEEQEEVQTPRRPKRAITSPLLVEEKGQHRPVNKELDRDQAEDADAEARSSTPPPLRLDLEQDLKNSDIVVTLREATPDALGSAGLDNEAFPREVTLIQPEDTSQHSTADLPISDPPVSPGASLRSLNLPSNIPQRRQSIVGSANAKIVRALIDIPAPAADRPPTSTSYSTSAIPTAGLYDSFTPSVPNMAHMLHRKIWVKRPNASATLVQIKEDDLVDDVRDMILRKYANSLGRTFDAPDMTLRIVARSEHGGPRSERVLGPEEEICRTIDACYPGGQTVDEALIIDVPPKRTPRPSPRNYQHTSYHALDEFRPQENGTDYFPPMPAIIQPTLPHNGRDHHHSITATDHPRSISVLNTGQVPPLPSPGGRRHRAEREHRPKYGRQHTSSPTIITHSSGAPAPGPSNPALPQVHLPHRASGRPRVDSSASEAHINGVPPAPPLPTPPAPEAPAMIRTNSQPPTPGSLPNGAHGHRSSRPRKTRKPTPEKLSSRSRNGPPQADPYGTNPALPNVSSMLDGSVPPINVLIVEDNIINLRILEGLMKRLKVRWQTAMNGQIAVDKWKLGGYHLVLMDIQMPIMNGLQATKEIRRLESVNGIGVFSSSSPGSTNEGGATIDANGDVAKSHDPSDDKLPKAEGLFKSPVIIVALTASSLQSDRHEALAAGCNDFLTKPVNFVWLERKVKEWGCMQALIDFDGWRKWKDYAAKAEEGKSEEQKRKEKEDEEKQKAKMEKMAKLQEITRKREEEKKQEKERQKAKRESLKANEDGTAS